MVVLVVCRDIDTILLDWKWSQLTHLLWYSPHCRGSEEGKLMYCIYDIV